MIPGFWFLVGAGAVKVASFGWLVSIATSPVAVGSRKRFLETNKEGLENLVKLGIGPAEPYLTALRQDFELLESHVETGWSETYLFSAATRVANWKFWEHTYGFVTGAYELGANAASAATRATGDAFNGVAKPLEEVFDRFNKYADEVFDSITPAPVKKNDSDNRHSRPD